MINFGWTPATEHPTEDCEVFVLAEVVDDNYYGWKKGDYILQSNCYDAESGFFGNSDDDRLRIVCWCRMMYPEVPDLYKNRTHIAFQTMAPVRD